MKRILITGVAGYIGSHIEALLETKGHSVVGIDNLSNGLPSRIPSNVIFRKVDILDFDKTAILFQDIEFDVVINCAGLKSVSDSFQRPSNYFETNSYAVSNLSETAGKNGVKLFIQASTAAVYGESSSRTLSESAGLNPHSPYGKSKLEAEQRLSLLNDLGIMKTISLRYFNVVGSLKRELMDENGTNLFPILKNRIQNGLRPLIYGDKYATQDGTCERDYIHVNDVAQANLALIGLEDYSNVPSVLNLGSGQARSVLEVVDMFKHKLNSELEPEFLEPRIGDVPRVIADMSISSSLLKLSNPSNFEKMVESSI
jgi:UDP-glucose 4-epimerase